MEYVQVFIHDYPQLLARFLSPPLLTEFIDQLEKLIVTQYPQFGGLTSLRHKFTSQSSYSAFQMSD